MSRIRTDRRAPLESTAVEHSRARGDGKRRKTLLEIGQQILDGFKADMEPNSGSAGRPASRSADRRTVEWNGKALEAAP